MRPEPVDAALAVEPIVGLGFALEALDVANLGAGIMGLDLPVAFRNAAQFECNSRGFGHESIIISLFNDAAEGVRPPSSTGILSSADPTVRPHCI